MELPKCKNSVQSIEILPNMKSLVRLTELLKGKAFVQSIKCLKAFSSFSLIATYNIMHIRMKQCLFTTDSLQLSMQSQHAITFSYVVISTQHCLSIKFVSKTDAVKLIVTLRCSNPLLSAMTCLLPMHTQGKNTAHFQPLMDQMGVRHGLIGFSVLFVVDVTSENPIHLRHL